MASKSFGAPRGKERIIVALDVDTPARAKRLVKNLSGDVGMFKIGMQLFNSAGPEIVRELKNSGNEIFLDLKLHDIPNTVAKASRVLTRLGVNIFNVHAGGGRAMMSAAAEATRDEASGLGIKPPLVVAVTVLTSLDRDALNNEVGIPGDVGERVIQWARMSQEAGLDGVVASPKEVKAIREACGPDFVVITPGIRPAGAASDDQKRIMTPLEAVREGSTYLVIGRPITGAESPAEAARGIGEEIMGL